MRIRKKQWRNGPGGKWDCRIRWYKGENDDIRLVVEDCERKISVYTDDKRYADHVWAVFKQGAPEPGTNQAFVSDLLELVGELKRS